MDRLIMKGFGKLDLGDGKSVLKACKSMKLKQCSSKRCEQGGTLVVTAGEIVGSIDDLLTLILDRLPVKSLVKFQLVSTHWRSLINTRLKSTPPAGIFFCFYPYPAYNEVLRVDYIPCLPNVKNNTIQPDWAGLIIKQSCNGLLLGTTDVFGLDWHENSPRKWFVCNPTTGQVATIPHPEFHGSKIGSHVTLCFDPTKSPYYKVVYLMCTIFPEDSYKMLYQLQIYSSETGIWSSCEYAGLYFYYCRYVDGVYWNGAVHWVSSQYSLYLNIEDGRLDSFPSPPNACFYCLVNRHHYVGECCDQMCYVSFNGLWQVDIYGLERDRSAWFLHYRVDLSSLCHIYPDITFDDEYLRLHCSPCRHHGADIADKSFRALCVVLGAEEKDSFLVFEAARRVIRCDLVSNTFQELFKLEETLSTFNACHYMESLCSV